MIQYLNKVYVLHHKPMVDRGNVLRKRLEEEGIACQWVENYSPEEINDEYEKYIENWEQFENIEIVHPYGRYQNFSKKISIGELSLFLKHLYCYEEQIKNNYENILILEDDCDIPKNFISYLENNMNDFLELNKDESITMLFIGTSHNFVSKNYKTGKYAHYARKSKNSLYPCIYQ